MSRENIPPLTLESLEAYRDHRGPTGGFLRAVLANDLLLATQSADCHNRAAFFDICEYVWMELPTAAYGSYEAVANRLKGA